MEFEKLKKEILNKIKPSEEEIEKVNNIAKEFGELLNKLNIKFYFGGSFAKGTFLKNITDIDIYLLMEKEDDLKIIKEKLKNLEGIKVLHGSRDYFQINYKGILFEMVPVLNIKKPEEAVNSTDISKFHVEFVKNEIKKNPKLKDEILLLKYFLKQKGIYGAESYNRGFSGYLSEVLVIYLGSFLDVIKFFSKTKIPIILPKMEEDLIKELRKSGKWNNYFNILDPVLNKRNLGMAVSEEKVAEMILESKKFLINPNFDKKNKEKELLNFYNKVKNKYVLLKVVFTDFFKKKYNNPDIIGSKMKNEGKKIEKLLKEANFDVVYSLFKFNKEKKEGIFYILVDKIQSVKKQQGPKVWLDNTIKFLEKHKDDLNFVNEFDLFSLIAKNKKIEDFLEEKCLKKNEKFEIIYE